MAKRTTVVFTKARRTGGKRSKVRPATSAGERQRNRAIRDWAYANGHDIKGRGRIPTEVLTAYNTAGAPS